MRGAAAALLVALVTGGCASTWQSNEAVQAQSYAAAADHVPRYAGKLRRLAVLPTYYEPVGSECSPLPVSEAARRLDEATRAFLADWKGYVVLDAAATRPAQALADLSRALGRWQAREPDARLPPQAQREQLRRLAAALRADGVLVLHAAPECIGVVDTALMLLAIGMPSFYGKALGRNFSAGLYEAATGSLVWQRYVSLGPRNEGMPHEGAAGVVENLLGLLENAIPEILLR